MSHYLVNYLFIYLVVLMFGVMCIFYFFTFRGANCLPEIVDGWKPLFNIFQK